MKCRMTISVDPELDAQIRSEAARDGVDVSTWLARLASVEATRRAYAAVAADRRASGRYSEDWMDAFADRRAELNRHRAGR